MNRNNENKKKYEKNALVFISEEKQIKKYKQSENDVKMIS